MSTAGPADALAVVSGEVARVLAGVDGGELGRLVGELRAPGRRWFCTGQGRSGLVAQMAAMRLMHLGLRAHVVGDATAPAMGSADALLVISASGTTPLSLHVAAIAHEMSAVVVLVTATAESPLRRLAQSTLAIPALASAQFGGSLFEQAALLVLDAAVLAVDAGDPVTRAEMQRRHANLR